MRLVSSGNSLISKADLVLSEQVFEHVFNLEEVFSEIVRLLKPDATSLHHFPGPNQWMEGHIHVPVPVLCKYKPWVLLWALGGRRSPGQEGFTWKETYVTNMETMKYCRFPTKGELRRWGYPRCTSLRLERKFNSCRILEFLVWADATSYHGGFKCEQKGLASGFVCALDEPLLKAPL